VLGGAAFVLVALLSPIAPVMQPVKAEEATEVVQTSAQAEAQKRKEEAERRKQEAIAKRQEEEQRRKEENEQKRAEAQKQREEAEARRKEAAEQAKAEAEKKKEEAEKARAEAEAKRKEEDEKRKAEAEAKRKEAEEKRKEADEVRKQAEAKKKEEAEKARAEADAKKKAEEETRKAEAEQKKAEAEKARAEADAKKKAEEEQRKAEAEKKKAEAEKARAEADAKKKAEEEQRKAEAEQKKAEARKAEAEKKKAEAEKARAEADAKKKAEEEQRKAEAEKKKAEAEKARAEADAKKKAEEEQRKAEAEQKKAEAEKARAEARAEAEAKKKAEDEKRLAVEAEKKAAAEKARAEVEAKKKADEEARKAAEAEKKAAAEKARAEAEAKKKADEEARKAAADKARADAEAKKTADEEARKAAEAEKKEAAEKARAEAEAKKKADDEARKAAEAEKKAAAEKAAEQARVEAEAKKKADDEARQVAAEKAKAEAETKKKADEEARKAAAEKAKAQAEAKKKADEAARKAAEAKKKADAEKAKADAEAKKKAAEDAKKEAEAVKRAEAARAAALAEAQQRAEKAKPRSYSAPVLGRGSKPQGVAVAESSASKLQTKEKKAKALQAIEKLSKEAEAKDKDAINKIGQLDRNIKSTQESYNKAKGKEKEAKLKELNKLRDEKKKVEKARKQAEAELQEDKRKLNTAKKVGTGGATHESFSLFDDAYYHGAHRRPGCAGCHISRLPCRLHALSDRKRLEPEADAEHLGGAQRCQYSALPSQVPSGRPPFRSLMALCPSNSLKDDCQSEARSSAEVVKVVPSSKLGIAECESYCNSNFGMESYRGVCKGYVIRSPFNDGVERGKAQCWLILGTAEPSHGFPDEVKIDRSSLVGKSNKLTFFKEFCGCESRVIHFRRQAFRTDLALKRHQLAMLRRDTPDSADIAALSDEVKTHELEEKKYARLTQLEGVYDWLPLRPPHRMAKGSEKLLPARLLELIKPGMIQNQKRSYGNYWEAPVRISKIFKKSDLSAFLYLCLDKSSSQENWYLATQEDPVSWATSEFRHLKNHSDDDVKAELGDLGDRSRSMALQPAGCYTNTKKAQDAVEEKVVGEVGQCPVQALTKPSNNSAIGLRTFWDGDAGAMQKLGAAQWLVDKLNNHQRVSHVGYTVAKWVSKGYNWWRGGKEKEEKGVQALHDFTNKQIQDMLERTTILLRGISKLFLVMEAASNTEDLEIKLVCAKEVLDQIFEVGGLLPKVSQNLAMRPDLVKDDFVRNKLKETQNANPSRDEAGTMEYMRMHNPTVAVPGLGQDMPLLDILKYTKALSAGSVGQVDLFTVRDDIDPTVRQQFMTLMPSGHGETVIVKTVFEETEQAYTNDWNLLEQFFTNFKDKLDATFTVMWKILEPMKTSIFDEFDLREEAKFTLQGKVMLQEFTDNINAGHYEPTLHRNSIKLTTPNAVATSSKYILIQSLAAGTPLKNYLEDSNGQVERIVDWKSNIYSAILMVYGHMVVKHGFFQSDPHNGNWFWEPKSKTVTLIDWGGVGQLDESTHCKLANLYDHMGELVKAWNDCEAVTLAGVPEIAGTYTRSGYSIYQAGENETALLFGRTYGVSYFNEALGYRLFYDEGKWELVLEYPGRQDLTTVVAELETPVTKMEQLGKMSPQKWKFFKISSGKHKFDKRVTVRVRDPDSCELPSRKEAYSLAAKKVGLGLNLLCEPEDIVVLPEAPLTQDEDSFSKWTDNGKRQLGCITKTEEETFVWWGLHSPMKLMVETRGTHRYVRLPDGDHDLDESPHILAPAGWVEGTFTEGSRDKVKGLPYAKKNMLLNSAQSQLALATALYDSDILVAAVLGLGAKDSVGLVGPEVPDEYVLLARCIVVFHGMLGDVVKENFVRFLVTGQQAYIQWLVRSGGDRFFKSWMKPAKEWSDLAVPALRVMEFDLELVCWLGFPHLHKCAPELELAERELETAEKSIESSKQDVKKELESLRGRAGVLGLTGTGPARPSLEKALAESQKKADSAKRSQSEAAARLKSWETQQKAKSKARESPLAAAARRARDAQSALGARAARASRQSRDASVGKEAKERKEGERQFAARPLIEKAKDKASSPFRRPPGSHSAISLNLKKKQEAKKPEEATSPDTSAGSTPAGLISEDTGTKPADRTEILEAAQVLRKEAQDLGRALRRWVAEAGPEKGESADLAEAEAEKTSEPCEVQLAAETEDEGPHISSPVGVPPTPVEVESLEPAADSADGSEVPAAAAAAPEGPARPREPGRRALEEPGSPEPGEGVRAGGAKQAKPRSPSLSPGPPQDVWMTVSPSRGDLGYPRAASPALGSPTLSPLSPFARGGSPVAYFRHTLSPTSSPFAGLRPPLRGIPPVVLQRRAASPLPAIPVRSVSPPRQPRSLSPQAVPGFCHMPHTQLREAPVGSRFLVPRSAWQAPQACPVRK
ncbi:unnamed protein product, partial [Effrenium voratum]